VIQFGEVRDHTAIEYARNSRLWARIQLWRNLYSFIFVISYFVSVLFIRARCTLYNSIPIPRNLKTILWILFSPWSIDLKNFHHSILSPSHAYLKSDLSKTFELDLSAHPPILYTFFLLPEEPVRNVFGLWHLNNKYPNSTTETTCGTYNMNSKWLGFWKLQ
jgi:hypothetical protein